MLSGETIDDIKTEFIKKRPILPPMCIATPYDRVGTQWTRPQPNAALLERMIRLASACKKTLDTMLARPMADLSFDVRLILFILTKVRLSKIPFILQIIFQPPMNSFDVVIHLLPTRVAKRSLSLSSKFKDEYKTELIPNKVPVVDFDPADCYLSDLIVILTLKMVGQIISNLCFRRLMNLLLSFSMTNMGEMR